MDMKKRYAGVICFVVGFLGAIYGGATISSDMDNYNNYLWSGYNYQSPWTGHEVSMIFIVAISVVLIIIGLYLIYASSNSDSQESGSQKYSDVEQLKQYKELLDNNVITQEEFESLKNKMLNR